MTEFSDPWRFGERGEREREREREREEGKRKVQL